MKSETVTEFTKDTKATKTHIAQLDKLAKEPTEQDFPVYISDDIERLDVVISAKGRDLPGGITPLPLTETYSAPVKRTARVVSSVGFALSGIDQRSFGRVTLPRFRGDTSLVKDSIYSTYGDRQRSSAVAFAPFVQTHVNLWDVDWTAVYLTGGVGARTVAGDPRPEYLAGISFGFGDRAFLTLASHWGREERLLLGETDEVMARPVPAAIGDDSAIGTKWARAFAVVLSWKL